MKKEWSDFLTGDGTWSYVWEARRQIKSMSKTGTTITYDYDRNGLRVRKTVNGTATEYTLNGTQITHLTNGTDWMHFYYGAGEKPVLVNFNGTMYTYVYSLQGDVVAILDAGGSVVVEYKYDAWGTLLSAPVVWSAHWDI